MNRIRIGIEICDEHISNMDFSRLNDGNPGIGGITYQMLLMSYSLYEYYNSEYEVIYFHYCKKNTYPNGIKSVICNDNIELLEKASLENLDCMFVNCNKSNDWYEHLREKKLNIWVRAGCYLDKREVDCIMKTPQVVRVISVASEEYDHYRDHDIIDRMICVENSMSFKDINERTDFSVSSRRVAYIGSLVPQKGFHYLAKVWPKLIKKFPDAHLDVIGSGKLYDNSQELGRFGIAEASYEECIMKYLSDENGNILPSVKFWGVVGANKYKLLSDISVGVVNPTALTECCCSSSLDFAACGIPVVTCGRYGIPSTVINKKTGLTYRFPISNNLYKCLCILLSDTELNKNLGYGARSFAETFDKRNMASKWNSEIRSYINGESVHYRKSNGNYYNDYKWFIILNAFFRRTLKMRFLPSAIDWKECFWVIGHSIMNLKRGIMG